MAAIIQQPHESVLPEPTSEWRLDTATRLVRPLRGVELIVKSSEHFCDGNFQLTIMATVESPLSCKQLKRRQRAAWWRTRRVFPVVGVAFPSLDQASFDLYETVEAAEQWAAQTCRVATNTTVSDVYLARSRQALDGITMTLVADPIRGARGCVLNMSHTLIDLKIYGILQEFINQLACPKTELGVDAVFWPETMANTIPRLPQSLSHAYSLRHQPTPKQLQDMLVVMQRSQERWGRSTIGIPLHPDYQHRPSRIHNKSVAFEPTETAAGFIFLKEAKVSLTAAFFACMTSGIAQTFPGNGDQEGAHLLFSANGRRFLDLSASNGLGPVAMPVIPAGMWLDAKNVNLRPTSRQGLLRLARAIEEAQNQDLTSPHIIAALDQLAPGLVKAFADSHNLPGGPSPPPSVGRPTLTSQGQFAQAVDATVKPGEDPLRMTDFNTGGRTTDPSVCFALNSFRDELRFNLLFDEQFFDRHDVMHMGYTVARLFRRLIGEEQGVAMAKL
ncbi:hypothetical protein BJX99DRAFT_263230 [Aspergillus californicus]